MSTGGVRRRQHDSSDSVSSYPPATKKNVALATLFLGSGETQPAQPELQCNPALPARNMHMHIQAWLVTTG
jgi:hypothetical protein